MSRQAVALLTKQTIDHDAVGNARTFGRERVDRSACGGDHLRRWIIAQDVHDRPGLVRPPRRRCCHFETFETCASGSTLPRHFVKIREILCGTAAMRFYLFPTKGSRLKVIASTMEFAWHRLPPVASVEKSAGARPRMPVCSTTRVKSAIVFSLTVDGSGSPICRIFGRLRPVYLRELLSRLTLPFTYTLQGSYSLHRGGSRGSPSATRSMGRHVKNCKSSMMATMISTNRWRSHP